MTVDRVSVRALLWGVNQGIGGRYRRDCLGMRGDRLHGWHLGRLGGAGGVIPRGRRRRWKAEFLGACDFATCPVVLECLECSRADALVDPAVVKHDFPLLSCILAVKILARFLVGVNEYIGRATVAGCNGAAMFGDEFDKRLLFVDVFLDVDGEGGAHHGFQEEVCLVGSI